MYLDGSAGLLPGCPIHLRILLTVDLSLHDGEVALDFVLGDGAADLDLLRLNNLSHQLTMINLDGLTFLILEGRRLQGKQHLLLNHLGDSLRWLFKASEPYRHLLLWIFRLLFRFQRQCRF